MTDLFDHLTLFLNIFNKNKFYYTAKLTFIHEINTRTLFINKSPHIMVLEIF